MADNNEFIGDSKIHQSLSGKGLNQPSREQLQRARSQANKQTMFAIPIAKHATVSPEQQERKLFYDLDIPEIYNFRYAVRQLKLENRRAEKFERPFSMLIIGFAAIPAIKENFADHAEEFVVREIAKTIVEYVELGIDIVTRFSEDKFMIVLPEQTGVQATMIAESIRTHFEKSVIDYRQYKIPVRASIGIACFPQHGTQWKELVAKADLATDLIYEAGGNAFRFSPSG